MAEENRSAELPGSSKTPASSPTPSVRILSPDGQSLPTNLDSNVEAIVSEGQSDQKQKSNTLSGSNVTPDSAEEEKESNNPVQQERVTYHVFRNRIDGSESELLVVAIYMETLKEKDTDGAVFSVTGEYPESEIPRPSKEQVSDTPDIKEIKDTEGSKDLRTDSNLSPDVQNPHKPAFSAFRRRLNRQHDPENPPDNLLGTPRRSHTMSSVRSSEYKTWLKDSEMLPKRFPNAKIIGYSLNMSGGVFDFDAASRHILKSLSRESYDKILFIAHGYGNVVIAKLLMENKIQRITKALRDSQENVKDCTAAVVTFASPIVVSQRHPAKVWTAAELQLPVKSLKLEYSPSLPWGMFRAAASAGGFALLSVLERPLHQSWTESASTTTHHELRFADSGPVEIGQKIQLQKEKEEQAKVQQMAESAYFSGPEDPEFDIFCKAIQKAIDSYDIIKAIEDGDFVMLYRLVETGSGIHVIGGMRQTVLHIAVSNQNGEMVKILSTSKYAKSLVNMQDANGDTALHIAVREMGTQGDRFVRRVLDKIIEILIKMGAEADIINHEGESVKSIIHGLKGIPKTTIRLIEEVQLTLGTPPEGNGTTACEETNIIVTTVFKPGTVKRSSVISISVMDLIYGSVNDTITDIIEREERRKRQREDEEEQRRKDQPSTRPKIEPQSKDILYRWYHIPMNNMAWVHDIFVRLNYNQLWPWPERYRDGEIPHSRCMLPQATVLNRLDGKPSKAKVVLMPYISYEDAQGQERYNQIVQETVKSYEKTSSESRDGSITSEEELKHLDTIPLSRTFNTTSRTDNQECAIKAYLNYGQKPYDLPLHLRRTLDQSYYYMIDDTSYRDRTQVVSRWNHTKNLLEDNHSDIHLKKTSDSFERDLELVPKHRGVGINHNILMVDQLWIWHIPNEDDQFDNIITCFPSRNGALPDEIDKLHESVVDEKYPLVFEDSTQPVMRLLSLCVDAFDPHQFRKSLQFLKCFESAVGSAEEDETKLFHKFQHDSDALYSLHEGYRRYSKLRSKLLNKLLDIREETKLLGEIKDILDEIKIIQAILADQRKVLESSALKSMLDVSIGVELYTRRPLDILEAIDRNIKSLEMHAISAENGVVHLLDLKQKQANLWEARSARAQAEETANQGNTLLLFTIVTIVFLPLSFLTSFFAISIAQFPRDNGGNINWPLDKLLGYVLGISFAVSIPCIVVAIKIQWITIPWSEFRYVYIRHMAIIALNMLRIFPRGVRKFGCRWEKRLTLGIIDFASPTEPNNNFRNDVKRGIDAKWNVADKYAGSNVRFSPLAGADLNLPNALKHIPKSSVESEFVAYYLDGD